MKRRIYATIDESPWAPCKACGLPKLEHSPETIIVCFRQRLRDPEITATEMLALVGSSVTSASQIATRLESPLQGSLRILHAELDAAFKERVAREDSDGTL